MLRHALCRKTHQSQSVKYEGYSNPNIETLAMDAAKFWKSQWNPEFQCAQTA